MMTTRKVAMGVVGFAVAAVLAAPAFAGLLGTGLSYDDGVRPTPWEGTTTFSFVSEEDDTFLIGYVEWAVFAPGAFPFAGYEPTEGKLAYVYQVFSTGKSAISNYSVGIENPADNIGKFIDVDELHDVTGDQPKDPMNLYPAPAGGASWDFDGIIQDGSSCGLVFSSERKPVEFDSIVINHGHYAVAEPIPSPGPNNIPEPGTLWLLGSGLVLMMAGRWFWRR
jgi:hypothetical protein